MVRRKVGAGALVGGLLLSLSLFALSSSAVAQDQYAGDQMCGKCHPTEYASYLKCGHKWIVVATGGQQPAANLYPWGVPLPPLPNGVT